MHNSVIKEIYSLIDAIEVAGRNRINLVPSENITSGAAAAVLSRQFGQRYVFPSIGETLLYWPGMSELSGLLSLVEKLACSMFGARYCTVRPLSGIHCMTIVLSFLKRRGIETVYFVPWEYGGHGNSIKLAERFGLEVRFLPFDSDSLDIDCKALQAVLPKNRGRTAVYIDQWVSLTVPNVRHLRNMVGDDVYIHHDTSHLMGLIAGHAKPCPLTLGANSFGGSTHKTLPGPQKAILAWDDEALSDLIEQEVCAFVSHPHTGAIAGLGIALAEFQTYGERYASQVLSNANIFASELANSGANVVRRRFGYTTTHQVVADLGYSSNLAELGKAMREISVSLNFLEGGILQCEKPVRFGVQELTLVGWHEDEMKKLAHILAAVFNGQDSASMSVEVSTLMSEKRAHRAFIS